MIDVMTAVRRSLGLINPAIRYRLIAVAIAGILTSGLDLLGILLLVPFLSFLGSRSVTGGDYSWLADRLPGGKSPEETVLVLALAATFLFVVKGASAIALLWYQSGLLNTAQVELSIRIVDGYSHTAWLTQQDSRTGALIRTAVNSTAAVALVVGSAIGAVSEAAVFVAVFLALTFVDPVLAIAALVYLSASGLLYLRLVRRAVVRRGSQVQQSAEQMNSSLVELVGGIRELVVRGTTDVFVSRFESASTRYLHAARYISVTNQGIRYLLEVLMIGGVAIVIFGATVAGSASGALVVIGVLLAGGLRLVPALNTLLIAVNNVRGNVSAVAIVEDEMSRLGVASTGDLSTTTATGVELTGGVRLQDVSVLYPGRTTPALDSLSLDIGRGQTIGVVGASGAGKSTLVDVILGLLEPTSGRVLLDKRELKSCLADWRSTIGFVPQEIFLMDASLEANIRLGHPRNESSGSRLTEAIRLAQLTDVVEQLPEGVDTLVGERGLRLSGGQRQRIGLARALYGRPSFLILDEATSALDNQTEKLIGQALRSLHGKLTMLVIAHRLSTVRACDRIAFLDDGKLVACAPFDELLVTNRKFADLVRLGSVDQEFL